MDDIGIKMGKEERAMALPAGMNGEGGDVISCLGHGGNGGAEGRDGVDAVVVVMSRGVPTGWWVVQPPVTG